MPVYEFECHRCGKIIEESHSIVSAPQTIPCLCGGHAIRIISHSSFSLKGAGWARDGYSSVIGDAIKSGASIRGTGE